MIPSRIQAVSSTLVPLALLAAPFVQAGSGDGGSSSAEGRPPDDAGGETTEATAQSEDPVPLRVDRGDGNLDLFIPREEELVYEARVEWGPFSNAVGTVTMSAGVEPYRGSLLLSGGTNSDDGERETGWMKAHAYGESVFYTLDATLEARHQPQKWPHLVYRSTQKGSEERRREILVGLREDKLQCSYRRDSDKGAPRGTRIWQQPTYREVPVGALDMTSAVYMVRSFVRSGLSSTKFPVLDKTELWEVELSYGDKAVQKTPAGQFSAVQVLLRAVRYPGEPVEEDDDDDFSGLFGLKGTIQLWVDRRTGIPVRIMGEVPVGITLDADIKLKSYSGTPKSFRPLPKGP